METQLCVPVVGLLILHAAVSSTKPLNDAMENKNLFPLRGCRAMKYLIRTGANNKNVFWVSCEGPENVVTF